MKKRYLFVSYVHEDAALARPVVEAVNAEFRRRGLDVETWSAYEDLTPGESWAGAITRAIEDSVGILLFLSPDAVQSYSLLNELGMTADDSQRLILTVLLRRVTDMPDAFKFYLTGSQRIDLSDAGEPAIVKAAKRIASATEEKLKEAGGVAAARPPVASAAAAGIAATIAQEVRGTPRADAAAEEDKPPDSVFVVHGHDEVALSEVEAYLKGLGVRPIILSKLGGAEQSLLQKFFKVAAEARFAIVIVSADDVGASRVQYEAAGVGAQALQFRARQNVILELGFFYGLLGWENVFVLYKGPEKVFPNFERPSDIEGAVFDAMDVTGGWRDSLNRKLAEAGFRLKKVAAKKGAGRRRAAQKN